MFEPIAIDVVLADNGLSAAKRCFLERRVADEASGLIQDLRLPAVAQVRLVVQPHDGRQGAAQISITIGGQPCRQPTSLPGEQKSDVNELANFGSSVLYGNRHLLLTPRVLQAIASAYPAHVVGLVPEMVRRGFSVEVAEEVTRKITPTLAADSRRYQIELLLSDFVPEVITVEAGEGFHRQTTKSGASHLSEMIGMMRDGAFYDLGVKPPPVRLVLNESLSDFDFRVHLGGLRGPVFTGLRNDEFLVNAVSRYVVDELKVAARRACNPASGLEFAIVTGEVTASRCEQEMNLTKWDTAGYAVLTIFHFFRTNAEFFLTATNVQLMLAKLSKAFPLLIVNVLERFQPQFVLDVLRALVREQFSIRDLRGIMEAMLELNGDLTDLASDEVAILPPAARLSRYAKPLAGQRAAERCADNVRLAMKRYIASQFAKEGDVTLLGTPEAFEARFRECRGQDRDVELRALVGAIAEESVDPSRPLVVLTAGDLRRRLREAIAIEFPYVAVLGREELNEVTWHEHRFLSWPATQHTSPRDLVIREQ